MRTWDQLELCVSPSAFCPSMARSFRFLSGKVLGCVMVWQDRKIMGFRAIPVGLSSSVPPTSYVSLGKLHNLSKPCVYGRLIGMSR